MLGAKILVVDDDLDDIIMLNECLTDAGFTNIQYMNVPQQVIAYLDSLEDQDLPRVVISDLNMPVCDGFDLLKSFKSHERYKNIKFIFLSTSALTREKQRAALLGAVDFLQKPMNFKDYKYIIDKIKQAIGENRNALGCFI